MGPVWSLARTELRSRWVALVGLGLIVALATAVVLAAAVGARRTSSTVERFQKYTDAADAGIQTSSTEQSAAVAAQVATLPEVQASTSRLLINGFPAGADESTPDFAIYTDPTGQYGNTIDRPLLLRGRLPDEQAPDEVVLDELAASILRLDVGDQVHVATWSTDDLDAVGNGTDFPGFNGPALDLTVVGVGRTSEGLGGNVERAGLVALAGPGLMDAHPGLGAWPPLVALRVANADRDLPVVADAVGASGDNHEVDLLSAKDKYLYSVHGSVDTLSTGLWIFALVAGLAALVTVGQAVSRQVSASTSTNEAVRALGMTRTQRAVASSMPAMVTAVIGVGIGVIAAIAVSPLLPTGIARKIEVHPGVWIDGVALAVGVVAIIGLLIGWSFLSASRSQRSSSTTVRSAGRPSTVARVLASWGTPPVIVTGVRNTFERRDRLSVPVRSALIAATVAVAGVIGAGVVISSLHDLRSDSTRWGWTWSSEPDAFSGGDPTEQLAQDDRLGAVAVEQSSTILIANLPLNGFAMKPLKGSMDFTVVSGRLPQGPSEIALDRRTMDHAGVSIGDTVEARQDVDIPPIDLTVVGSAVVPDDSGTVGTAVLTPDGLERVHHDPIQTTALLRYPDGVDPAALEQQLSDDYGLSFPLFAHAQLPGPVTNVSQGRGVAIALAVFFALLGVAGLFHALTLSTRRRRPDFSVLRAMGFRRRQVRESVVAQAVTISIVGLAIGVPIGLIVGRAFWHRLIADIAVTTWASTPWMLIGIVIPAALLAAAFVSLWPARSAAHAPTIRILQDD